MTERTKTEKVPGAALGVALVALHKVTKQTGIYNSDPLLHAGNTILAMAACAEEAITRVGVLLEEQDD